MDDAEDYFVGQIFTPYAEFLEKTSEYRRRFELLDSETINVSQNVHSSRDDARTLVKCDKIKLRKLEIEKNRDLAKIARLRNRIILMQQQKRRQNMDRFLEFNRRAAVPGSDQKWTKQEAAIMAFGSILDGPEPAKLMPLVEEALPAIVEILCGRNVSVRDTAAWALGRVIDTCPDVVANAELLQKVLPALSSGLHQEPRVANNVCWTIVSLVKACYELAVSDGTDASGQPDTFALSDVFRALIQDILELSKRSDSNQSNLQITAYEALVELIEHSPKDCHSFVQEMALDLLQILRAKHRSEKEENVDGDLASDSTYPEQAAIAPIFDSPDRILLLPLTRERLPTILEAMRDENVSIRISAFSAVGLVLDTSAEVVRNPDFMREIMPALSSGLHQEPRVASNVCWTIVSLVKACYELAVSNGTDASGQPDTFALSDVFRALIQDVLEISKRSDSNQSNLQITAYEALVELIEHSPKDCHSFVQEMALDLLQILRAKHRSEKEENVDGDLASDSTYPEQAAIAPIFDSPDRILLLPLTRERLPTILEAMRDENVLIRDSAAWALGRVIDTCPEVVANAELLQKVLPALSSGLHQEPRVASNVCWTIVSLVKACYELAVSNGTDASGQPDTFALSDVYEDWIQDILELSKRSDSNQSNLQITAYEALVELIEHSPKDCHSFVQEMALDLLQILQGKHRSEMIFADGNLGADLASDSTIPERGEKKKSQNGNNKKSKKNGKKENDSSETSDSEHDEKREFAVVGFQPKTRITFLAR
ncbi:unnamed protein product [Caenorhabditis angaria]|uniref:Importin subunit beta-1/Transportin-1-like TPR repeats domain-containing protein n=1 Tax=Caenorhabditis angaria TaxID=860376 RepID=A0A9P1I6X3_9PELO|nr:unnamed protein product [Caenorhabditis angaria]